MRWLIVGAGAIGSLVGARLAQAGETVVLVVRPHTAAHLAQHGLTLRAPDSTYTAHLPAVTTVAEARTRFGDFDAIAFTMKAFGVQTAAEDLAHAGYTQTPVLTFQNGVGSEEIAAQVLPNAPIVSASITVPVEVPGPGVVVAKAKGGIGLACVQHCTAHTLETLARTFQRAHFPVHLHTDYRAMVWSKLLLNIIGNATSAITGLPPQRIIADPVLFEVEHLAWQEAYTVMQAHRIPVVNLPGYPLRWFARLVRWLPAVLLRPVLVRLVASGRGGKMPSLYLDIEAGRTQLEIDFLNGAVVKAGRAVNIPTPVNETLTTLVWRVAEDPATRQRFRAHPHELAREVAHACACGRQP
ncbi:MAG: ketopantoate reductase family protein [Ardenticatenia bacterium]|nr:MAG: ketopantoate reductase family protein [Ardenticatenia bacterium]